jgi:hypothetical protein
MKVGTRIGINRIVRVIARLRVRIEDRIRCSRTCLKSEALCNTLYNLPGMSSDSNVTADPLQTVQSVTFIRAVE